jgi:hypothetical protein
MTVTAKSMLEFVSLDILQDPTAKKWPVPQLCRMFNRAQRLAVKFRPEACTQQISIDLDEGAMQVLTEGCTQLLRPICNSGTKTAVTMPHNGRAILDAQAPGWRARNTTTEIEHVLYDPERDPLAFETYPPAATGAAIDAVVARLPDDIDIPADDAELDDVTGNLGLRDSFAEAVQELIFFQCFYKDSQSAAQGSRAAGHLSNAASLLGVDQKALLAAAPRADDTDAGPGTSN